MSPSAVGVLFKSPTPSMVARAEAKLHHALTTILLWLGFTPSPTSSSLDHLWAFPAGDGCAACRALGTTCYIPLPIALMSHGIPSTSSNLDGEGEGEHPSLELLPAPCDRCAFWGYRCSLDGYSILFKWQREYDGVWWMFTDLLLSDMGRSERMPYTAGVVVGRLGEAAVVDPPAGVQRALVDAWEAAERVSFARKYDKEARQ